MLEEEWHTISIMKFYNYNVLPAVVVKLGTLIWLSCLPFLFVKHDGIYNTIMAFPGSTRVDIYLFYDLNINNNLFNIIGVVTYIRSISFFNNGINSVIVNFAANIILLQYWIS